jgi:hypothetical protein
MLMLVTGLEARSEDSTDLIDLEGVLQRRQLNRLTWCEIAVAALREYAEDIESGVLSRR